MSEPEIGQWVIVRSGRYAERVGRVVVVGDRGHYCRLELEAAEPEAEYPAETLWFVTRELRPMKSRAEVRRPAWPAKMSDPAELGAMGQALAKAGLVAVEERRGR